MNETKQDIIALVDQVSRDAEAKGALKSIQTQTSVIADADLPFIIRCVDSLERKEAAQKKAPKPSKPDKPMNPFLPYDPDLFVTDISATHVCLLNKFNVVDRHLLFVTREFESQAKLISPEDMQAAVWGLEVMDGLVFFNGGENAGASQPHKHLQMVPLPQWQECVNPMEAFLLSQPVSEAVKKLPAVAFPLVAAKVDKLVTQGDIRAIHDLYLQGLKLLELIEGDEEEASGDYNFLLTRRLMWIVPRTSGKVQGVGVNALGYAGTILLKRMEQSASVESIGPLKLLALCCESEHSE